jgi:hypothetical protein
MNSNRGIYCDIEYYRDSDGVWHMNFRGIDVINETANNDKELFRYIDSLLDEDGGFSASFF